MAVLNDSEARASPAALHAFEAFGLELEYVIVDRVTLDVLPIADRVLQTSSCADHPVSEWIAENFGWSNELALHVLELKNVRPGALETLCGDFQKHCVDMNAALTRHGARLMPGAMHPWMDPKRETHLWPHDNAAVYAAYDRLFDCRSHGWANLQSTHVNLPFSGDAEFARLHAAVRAVLPIVPALTAASPYAAGRAAGPLDYRLEAYRTNADAVPELNGEMIPDPIAGRDEYEQRILAPLYRAIAPHDPDKALQHDWLNARAAIPRFDRSALEIRVIDVQECPAMDVGLAAAITDLIELLYEERFRAALLATQLPTHRLAKLFLACVHDADRARVDDPDYLGIFGVSRDCTASDLWSRIAEMLDRRDARHRNVWSAPLDFALTRGPLARRLLRAVGPRPNRPALHELYTALCDALTAGKPFDP